MTIEQEILSYVKADSSVEPLNLEVLSRLHLQIRPEKGNALVFVTNERVLTHIKNSPELAVVALHVEKDKATLFGRTVVTFTHWPHNLVAAVELDGHTVKKVAYIHLEI